MIRLLGAAVLGVLLAVYAAYTALAVLACVGPVDRWLRAHRIGRRPIRSLLPFWGLFAQQFGMFDLDVRCRAVPADADGGPGGEPGDWTALTRGRWRPWSFLWRPWHRPDQTGQVLALRILQGGGQSAAEALRHTPGYARIMRRARIELGAGGDTDADDPIEFQIVLSRGHWAAVPPKVVFSSSTSTAAAGERP